MTKLTRLLLLVSFSLCALAFSSCSSLLDFNECTSNTQCAPFGEDLVCSAQGYCVLPSSLEQCTNSRCAENYGENFICAADNSCVEATNEICTKVVGPVDRDDTVILGTIFPTVGEYSASGLPRQNSVEMAITEFNDAGGLPDGRKLAFIGCDDGGNKEQGVMAAQHLAETIGVPAIVGPAFSGVFLEVNSSVTIPAGTMSISPSATSPLITGLFEDGLSWRTAANDLFQGVAIADRVRAEGASKVVAFGKGDPYGQGLLNSVGIELLKDLNAEDYYSREYINPAEGAPDFPKLVVDATGEMPDADVVLLLGTIEVVDIIDNYEILLADSEKKPLYILTDGGKNAEKLMPVLEKHKDKGLAARIKGTEPDHRNGTLYTSFALSYEQKFGEPPGTFTANAYDATYLLAYAISALESDQEVTGANIAQSFPKLTDGDEHNVGPANIRDGVSTLSSGGTLNFTGASGPLDFEEGTGEAPANVSLWSIEDRDDNEVRFTTSGTYIIGDDGKGTWEEL